LSAMPMPRVRRVIRLAWRFLAKLGKNQPAKTVRNLRWAPRNAAACARLISDIVREPHAVAGRRLRMMRGIASLLRSREEYRSWLSRLPRWRRGRLPAEVVDRVDHAVELLVTG
jgi:hypothetical protein